MGLEKEATEDIIVDEDFLDFIFTRVNKRKANGPSGIGYSMWEHAYKAHKQKFIDFINYELNSTIVNDELR